MVENEKAEKVCKLDEEVEGEGETCWETLPPELRARISFFSKKLDSNFFILNSKV